MKPSYRGSRLYLWWSFWFAWGVVFLLVFGGLLGVERIVDLAGISIPSMVAIIVGNLGVHRGFGSLDFSNRKHDNRGKSQKQKRIMSMQLGDKRNV
ncbi:hypothetical protein [Bartonella machadoae]|uniref:hypothetical protein n=1 Tax=Bartonella machadoae TaxID=2893471 RepID=UPI001F4C9FE4|nr:hypothetical protein [Bartonella machadoae]UNE53525.1 hypothetical protein LNM86_07555 [Bartonella machadoae]UNE54187.1 hypothetical protein LNM86_11785 [Bartonella machadoae]UNE55100.1 hypothetical protein LNM86_04520 [Bartonella machadoae]UNE55407.1 hypothetical protein LNM86_06300 [Bartonella machadoae]